MIIKLGNREINQISSSVIRTMDTAVDEWSAIIAHQYGDDSELDKLVVPASFAPAVASVDGVKKVTGRKLITRRTLTSKGEGLLLRGFSKTEAITRSNPKEQREFRNNSLSEITAHYAAIHGFFTKIDGDLEEEVNERFDNVKIKAQDFVFDFLQNLARQRGILTSSDEDGNLYYLRARTNQAPVGTIYEGPDGIVPISEEFNAEWDDRRLFQQYQSVNDSPFAYLKKEPQAVSKDTRVKQVTFKTVLMNTLVKGAGQKQVDFTRNVTIAKAFTMPFTTNGWDDPKGNQWRENTTVTVVSPSLFVPDGFTFLIRAVQYDQDNQAGKRATLSLVPPSLLAGGPVLLPPTWG